MTQADLVHSIGNTLTELDNKLMSGNPPMGSVPWEQIFAMRKHLDDQQRALVAKQIKDDNVEFKALTGLIEAATKKLEAEIATQNKIDDIINTIANISTSVDAILSKF